MAAKTILALILIAAAMLAGCALPEGAAPPPPPAATEPPAKPTDAAFPTATPPAPTEVPAAVSEPPAASSGPLAVEEVEKMLADRLGMPVGGTAVLSVEPVNWPNSCLGVDTLDMMCLDVITPGYRIVVEVDGQPVEVHTNQDLSQAYVAGSATPPGAAASGALVTWQSPGNPCVEAQIDAAAVHFGPCGGQLSEVALDSPGRAAQLANFVALYASYSAQTPAGAVSLAGSGPARAEPSDQRALAEWADAVVVEAAAGGLGPASDPALRWSRAGGIAGFCDGLTVYADGLAPATSCKTEPASELGERWLSSSQAAQLFGWIDGLASFGFGQKDQAVADAMAVALDFLGEGATEAAATDQQAMLDFAGQVFTFGALATDTRSVSAQGDVAMLSGPGTQFAPVGQVSGGQTAFVTGVSQDGRWWRVLCPDDTVGDCWLPADQTTPS